MFSCIFWKRY